MSVLIVTSLGDIVVDLLADKCPLTSKNFLKLCKIKYYNGCIFHTVQKDFTAQTGDPTGTGSGGDSVYKFLYGDQARFFSDEIRLDLKHTKTGTVAMASVGENHNASQFYITLQDDLDYLDGKHIVFGEVAEGHDTLSRINETYVDEKGRPYKNIRIKHTYILDDPFDDPPQLAEMIPDASPEGKPKDEFNDDVRLEDDWVPLDENLAPAELEELVRSKQAHSSAVVLETIGDIPDAEIKPPDDVLFVCKLNPVTEDEDLHTIFSRFGTVLSAEVIRDYKTGDSLCYAFIEFESREACEQAYFKQMDNALIDDRRIHVDFSQSVAKLWSQYRRKDYGKGKGSGCFKCGSVDLIAKDCTGGPGSKQPQKYVLKEDNTQRGGANSSYEMVFDGDNPESPRREQKHSEHYPNDRYERRKMKGEDPQSRDPKKRESYGRHREHDKSRGYKEDELRQENKETRPHGNRDDRYYEEWKSEKYRNRHRDPDVDKVDEGGLHRKSSEHGRRGRSSDGRHLEEHSREKDRDSRRDRDDDNEDEQEHRKRSVEHGRHTGKGNDEDYRKAADRETYAEKSEGRDNRKRSADVDERAEKRRHRDDKRR